MKLRFLRKEVLSLSLIFVLIGVCQRDAFGGRWVLTGYGWKWFEYCSVSPKYDTYVDDENPGLSYGSASDLYVGDAHYNEPAKTCRTYLMFDLDTIPAGSTIIAAKLHLRSSGIGPNPKIVVGAHYLPDNTWDDSITWGSAPVTFDVTATDTQTIGSSGRWFEWDVTKDAQTVYKGGLQYLSEVLKNTTEGTHQWCGFDSNEGPEANFRPYLEVWYDPDGMVITSGTEGYVTKRSSELSFGPGSGSNLPPIPEGFFGPGSDPFDGIISLKGHPFGPESGCADTLINRTGALFLSNSHPNDVVPIELVELNLVSVEPIKVTFGGGMTESFFDVFVEITSPSSSTGIIGLQSATGGVFSYDIISPNLLISFLPTGLIGEPNELEIPGHPLYPAPIVMEQTLWYPWQNSPTAEVKQFGYDGFYPSSELSEPLIMALSYMGGPCGQLDFLTPEKVNPYFLIEAEEFIELLGEDSVRSMTPTEWEQLIEQFADPTSDKDGELYPDTEFLPSGLYVYDGGGEDPCGSGYPYPNDPGLVMEWGNSSSMEDGNDYASAWVFDYDQDPDISNSIIKVSVFPPSKSNINKVSLDLIDNAGMIRSWWWNVPGVIPYDVGTTVTIDTSKAGLGATSPQANGYNSAAAFNINNVQSIAADENGTYFPSVVVPPPGRSVPALWNYWYNLSVIPKTPPAAVPAKYYTKWSQRPVLVDTNDPKLILGWDEPSNYYWKSIVADDWNCVDDRPVTDFHWWGSFIGWKQPYPPPVMPKAFHLGIWTDIKAGAPGNPDPFSHPQFLIWENYCESYVWNYYGYDVPPDETDPNFYKNETCFQFNQLLSEEDWFYQDPNDLWDGDPNASVYWLSIAAIYDMNDFVKYPWGWKTRKPHWNDDAVIIFDVNMPPFDYPAGFPLPPNWPPRIGAKWNAGMPIKYPAGISWDVCFELTTNQPDPDEPVSADLFPDGIVNNKDLVIIANQWLTSGP